MKTTKTYPLLTKATLLYCAFAVLIISAWTIPLRGTDKKPPKNTANRKFASQPNIILFMADDFGYELPTYTGGQSYSTPNMDSMAANGIQFPQAYAHPDGFPSRLAFQTGKYNIRNYQDWGILPYDQKTLGNMLHDAGYATCFVGKWNMDGGDSTIHRAGYDNYRVFLPFADHENDSEFRHQYINPHLYENGNFLSPAQTNGRFSEDMYYEYLADFIDKNGSQPFFAVIANSLPRNPYAPVPGDPAFIGFDPDTATVSDPKYFPEMVNYLDKTIGKVLQKLRDNGIAQNTVIMFCADNTTSTGITSQFNGKPVQGAKNLTTKAGLQDPLQVYWPGTIPPGQVCRSLVDYTDFLPTLADIAGIPVPSDYGVLDGTSFYHNLVGTPGTNRSWVYCYWDNSPGGTNNPFRFVYDTAYKLYKDTFGVETFYRLASDIKEKKPVANGNLTPAEVAVKQNFETVIDQIHR